MPVLVAVKQGASGHHFCVEHGAPTHFSPKKTAVAV
jgi:hypothetical protein